MNLMLGFSLSLLGGQPTFTVDWDGEPWIPKRKKALFALVVFFIFPVAFLLPSLAQGSNDTEGLSCAISLGIKAHSGIEL